jgi:hypothetical protein
MESMEQMEKLTPRPLGWGVLLGLRISIVIATVVISLPIFLAIPLILALAFFGLELA